MHLVPIFSPPITTITRKHTLVAIVPVTITTMNAGIASALFTRTSLEAFVIWMRTRLALWSLTRTSLESFANWLDWRAIA